MAVNDDEGAVYVERNALAFLRAWPDVPPALVAVYPRLVYRGLLFDDPNADVDKKKFPGSLRLTENGERLRELVCGQSYNFFLRKDMEALGLYPDDREYDTVLKSNPPPGAVGVMGHPSTPVGLKALLEINRDTRSRLNGAISKLLPRKARG